MNKFNLENMRKLTCATYLLIAYHCCMRIDEMNRLKIENFNINSEFIEYVEVYSKNNDCHKLAINDYKKIRIYNNNDNLKDDYNVIMKYISLRKENRNYVPKQLLK